MRHCLKKNDVRSFSILLENDATSRNILRGPTLFLVIKIHDPSLYLPQHVTQAIHIANSKLHRTAPT